MTTSPLTSAAAIQEFVRAHGRVHVIGAGSKTALHASTADCALADLSGLRGISEYQPQEYTLTARAGTPVREIQAELRAQGQYLPFDPLLPEMATIGGAVACNVSGSRRYRYGGARDFILGAQVVDGLGRAFSVGGKVVKNSAGFDLSKFLVGSLGRYAIMTALTFKVFPDAPRRRTLRFSYRSLADLLGALYYLNQNIFELDSLDFEPAADGWSLHAGLAGFDETLPARARRLTEALRGGTDLLAADDAADAAQTGDPLSGLTRMHLAKVVIAPKQIPRFDAAIANMQRRYSAGGNIALVAADDIQRLDQALRAQGLRGLVIRGDVESALIGSPLEDTLAARVKQVLDPQNKLR